MVAPESSNSRPDSQQRKRLHLSTSETMVSSDQQASTHPEVRADGFAPPLTYQQNRRTQQAIRAAEGKPKRGPTRGLNSRRWREKNPGEKPYAKISNSMRRVVGEKAPQFISECSLWVKEYCPLNCRNWNRMEKKDKERLFDKIQREWNLPRLVGGVNVKRALNAQCAVLYRGWRYHLKEENFNGYTKEQAKARRPPSISKTKWDWLVDEFWSDPKQQAISDKNRRNRLKQTIKHSNGAKSTTRILEELITVPPTQSLNANDNANGDADNDANENADHGDADGQNEKDPIYVKLYEKTHRHKAGTIDPDAASNLNQLRELHAKEIEEHGVDNLTPFEAFPKVLSECSGYIRGLGPGPKPPKKHRSDVDASEVRDELQHLHQVVAQREAEISDLRSENTLLKERMEEMKLELVEREKKMKEESVERENKLRQDLMTEFKAMLNSSKRAV